MTPTFTIPAAALADALTLLSVAMERKTTMPVLSYVLVDGGDATIKLTATDMDCLVSTSVAATIASPFAVCLPLREVLELVKLLDSDVAVTLDGAGAWLKSGTTKQKFPTMAADDFPAIQPATTTVATLNGLLLASMIAAAMIAAETNPNGEDKWKCIEVAAKDGELSITGGNNARIANATTPCESEFYVLLSLRHVEVLAAFAAKSESVTLSLSDNVFTAKSDRGETTLKQMAVKWPDWKMLIAPSYIHEIAIDPATFIPALRRTILTCNDSKVARADFHLTPTAMTITAIGRDRTSEEAITITCPSLNGEPLTFGVHGNQLLDFFRVVKGGALWRIPANSPAQMLTPVEPLPFRFRYIQATMR